MELETVEDLKKEITKLDESDKTTGLTDFGFGRISAYRDCLTLVNNLPIHNVSHCDDSDGLLDEWNEIIQEIADEEMIMINNKILRYLKGNFEPPKRK